MKIALIGYGKMGKEIEKIALNRGHEIVCIIDINNQEDFESEAFKSADVAIEFTNPMLLYGIRQCLAAGFGDTGVVHHFVGDGDLTAKLLPFQHQYPIFCPGKVQRGGQPRRVAADNDYIVQILHQS